MARRSRAPPCPLPPRGSRPTSCWYTGRARRRRTSRSATRPSCRRSEEHTPELQSQSNLVCRLLLEKKKINRHTVHYCITYPIIATFQIKHSLRLPQRNPNQLTHQTNQTYQPYLIVIKRHIRTTIPT